MAAEMGALQPVNVRMFRVSSDAAAQRAEMSGGQGDGRAPPTIGPRPELPPPLPAPSPAGGSTSLEQYHAQCTAQIILACAPTCNATHHGYELLATIDGADTKFSRSLAGPAVLLGRGGGPGLPGFDAGLGPPGAVKRPQRFPM